MIVGHWTAHDYPLVCHDGRQFCKMPDGRLLEVDYDMIFTMACDGSLLGEDEEAQQFIRYLCGPVEDD